MLSVVATRYAKALVDVITAPGSGLDPAKTLDELRAVKAIIDDSAVLRNALLSPAVPPARKRAVIARLIEPLGVSPQVRNFLFIVIGHRRTHELASIVEAYEALLDERLGYVRADVSSAHPLSNLQRANLEVELSTPRCSRASSRASARRYTTAACGGNWSACERSSQAVSGEWLVVTGAHDCSPLTAHH